MSESPPTTNKPDPSVLAGIWGLASIVFFLLLFALRLSILPYPVEYKFTEEQREDILARVNSGELVWPEDEVTEEFIIGLGAEVIRHGEKPDVIDVILIVGLAIFLGVLATVAFAPINKYIRIIAAGAVLLSPFWIRAAAPSLRLVIVAVITLGVVLLVFWFFAGGGRSRRASLGRTEEAYQNAKTDYLNRGGN